MPRKLAALVSRFQHLTYTVGEASNALTLLTTALMARRLDTDTFGVAVAVLATGGILSELSEFGFPSLLNRSVAQHPERGWSETRSALFRQGALVIPMMVAMAFYLRATRTPPDLVVPALLIAASLVFRTMKNSLRGACRAVRMFGVESAFLWTERLSILVFSAAALLSGWGLPGVAIVFFTVRLVDVTAFAVVVRHNLLKMGNAPGALRYAAAWPFAIGGLMWSLYYQVDATMLSLLATARDTGLYGAVYRFLDVFQVLPRVLVAVAYPILVTLWLKDRAGFVGRLKDLRLRLNLAAVPLLAAVFITAPFFLELAFGPRFREGAPALRAILVGVFFSCQSVVYASALTASGHEKRVAGSLTLTVLVNVALNATLIPRMGYLGAALATAVTEALYAGLLTLQARRLGLYRGEDRDAAQAETGLPVTQPPAAEG